MVCNIKLVFNISCQKGSIDFDTKVTAELERQQPSAIPLSYILKYSENEETEIETNVNIHIRLLPSNGTILDKYNTPYRMGMYAIL